MSDAFTTAAFESAASKYQGDWDAFEQEPVDDYGFSEAERRAHVAGWKAARDHLAAQEPTDAEVEAATRVIYVRSHHSTGRQAPWERLDLEEQGAWLEDGRAALTAAKEARHG